MKAINIKNATVELKGQKILKNLNFEIEQGFCSLTCKIIVYY